MAKKKEEPLHPIFPRKEVEGEMPDIFPEYVEPKKGNVNPKAKTNSRRKKADEEEENPEE